jgi:hypothetical protein
VPALALALELLALIALPASIGALGVGDSFCRPSTRWCCGTSCARCGWPTSASSPWCCRRRGAVAARQPLAAAAWLLIPAAQFAWLSVFALIGGSLYEQRTRSATNPSIRPSGAPRDAQLELDRERGRFMDTIYGEARGGNLAGAWQTIERELAVQLRLRVLRLAARSLGGLDDPRLATRLAQDYISRALARDNARVTRLVQRCLAADPSFSSALGRRDAARRRAGAPGR